MKSTVKAEANIVRPATMHSEALGQYIADQTAGDVFELQRLGATKGWQFLKAVPGLTAAETKALIDEAANVEHSLAAPKAGV